MRLFDLSLREHINWRIGFALATGVVFTLAALIASVLWNQAELRQRYELETANREILLASRAQQANAAIAALTTLFSAAQSVDADQFSLLANAAIERWPFLRAAFYAPRVMPADRASFEASVADSGLPGFRIQDDGKAEFHYPVRYYEPFTPLTSRWLGLDLMATPHVAAAINQAIATDDTLIASGGGPFGQEAEHWLLHSLYSHRGSPTADLRQQLANGVVGFALAPAALSADIPVPGEWLRISLRQGASSQALFEQGELPPTGLFGLFRLVKRHEFPLAEDRLVAEFGRDVGLAELLGTAGVAALVLGIFTTLLFLLQVAHGNARRAAERRDQQLNQRTLEAESANRAKSYFLANMSHEIRTPMNAVLGLLQLLQHTELSQRQLDYAQKAQSAAQALLGILNDILDFTKVEAGKLELEQVPFRIDRVLRDLSVVLSVAVRNKDVEVLFDLDSTIPPALIGDPMRLQQVLLNLTGNAIKFTEHGEVVVVLRAIAVDAEHARIEFTVRDSGIGIAADKLTTIFDGFTQAESSTTRRFGGTGLGLTISVRLVRLMGGELQVSSEPGQGSRFYFTLDFTRGAADMTLDAEERRIPGSGTERRRRLHVLIVDDNAIAREVLQHMVCQLGWTPDVAVGGAEAIVRMEQAAANGRPYDTVLLDWNMPEMDGWEVAQHIRAHHLGEKSPVIIMVTAHGRETLAERLESASNPLDGFLVKPVTASMLFDAVADATAGDTVSANRRMAATPPGQALVGLRLLVVEDNAMNQQVARELLTYQGAQVEVAGDGRQGIERVAAAQPPFDAVLMDIQMPVMDGYEATRILRQEMGWTALPIIAMTANAMASDREACLAAGMNDHVGKPIDINELVATVRRHCPMSHPTPSAKSPSAPPSALASAFTSPPTNPASSVIPSMPVGFDLAAALQRLAGDRAFYAVLARNLRADQGDSIEQARRQLAAGDHTGAVRTLHTLKGVAGTLGAQSLAQLTAAVEASVKAGAPVSDSAVLLDRLAGTLAEAIEVLEGVANTFAPPAAIPATALPATAIPAAAANAIIPLLAELEPYLTASNMRALNILTALKQACGGALPAQHAALEAALNRLDFATALAETRRWRDEMPGMGHDASALSSHTPKSTSSA